MKKTLQQVLEFHEMFDHLISKTFNDQIPTEVRVLRYNLINEEYKELQKAIADNNMLEIADAFCDLQYVVNGTIISHGLQNNWEQGFKPNLLDYGCHFLDGVSDMYAIKSLFPIEQYKEAMGVDLIFVLLKMEYYINDTMEQFSPVISKFNLMFDEVHRSNMSKTCIDKNEAILTSNTRSKEFHCMTEYFERNGRWVVIRSSDRKALKSINYSKPNLAQFI